MRLDGAVHGGGGPGNGGVRGGLEGGGGTTALFSAEGPLPLLTGPGGRGRAVTARPHANPPPPQSNGGGVVCWFHEEAPTPDLPLRLPAQT